MGTCYNAHRKTTLTGQYLLTGIMYFFVHYVSCVIRNSTTTQGTNRKSEIQ